MVIVDPIDHNQITVIEDEIDELEQVEGKWSVSDILDQNVVEDQDTTVIEMSDEDGMSEWINTLDQIVGFPDDFYTVQLTKLGIKNQQKLTNPATGEVNEPPFYIISKGVHWLLPSLGWWAFADF